VIGKSIFDKITYGQPGRYASVQKAKKAFRAEFGLGYL
jgi:hypothetical protein